MQRNEQSPRIEGMGRDHEPYYMMIPPENPPNYLCERILGAVERERMRQGRTRLMVSSLSGISSLVGLVFALPALLRAADVTGFASYAPLLVSDSDMISTHLGTFMFTLLETLPSFEVTVTLLLLAILLVSFKNVVRGCLQTHLTLLSITRFSTRAY